MSEAVTTNNFRQRIASHMFSGATLPQVTHVAFGDGGHTGNVAKPMDVTRTTLVHELLRKPVVNLIQEDIYSVTGTGEVAANELIGVSVSEAALLDSAGNMLGYKNFAPKVKEADEVYDIRIKLKF